jgi:exopolyphosphatase/guanosine-5'-triphosphate,3'-diphosphate pyrophosphatase
MTRVAAVDCGTNTIRLLITDLDPATNQQRDLVRRSEIVRLGQDVDRTGEFATEALRRTFRVSDEYATLIAEARAACVRVVATSAARDARNGEEFRAGMADRFHTDVEMISGEEEARLAYAGAVRGVEGHEKAIAPELVVDVGGGSTEFVIDIDGRIVGQSLDIGSVRMTERYLVADPPTADEIATAREAIEQSLAALTVPIARARTLVGVAGTVTTVAAMSLGLDVYDSARVHRAWLPAAAVAASVGELARVTVDERRSLGFMAPGRADVIVGGGLIVEEVLGKLGLPGMLASESDILDGIAWSQI